jgi:hypothetical protein
MMESRKVKIAKPKVKKVRDVSTKPAIVSPQEIAAALGAEPLGIKVPTGSPPDLHLHLFKSITEEIVSSGGRPARKGNTERKKIPLTQGEWAQLQDMADSFASYGKSISPAQLGGLIVSEGLRHYRATNSTEHDELEELTAAAGSGQVSDRLKPIANAMIQELKKRKRARKGSLE